MGASLRPPSLLPQGVSEVVVSIGVVGLEVHRSLECRKSAIQIVAAIQSHAKVDEHAGAVGPRSRRSRVISDRLGPPAPIEKPASEGVVDPEVARVFRLRTL